MSVPVVTDLLANIQSMASDSKLPRRGSYGIDAPYAAAFVIVLAAVVVVAEIVGVVLSGKLRGLLPAAIILAIVGFGLHTSLRGKFVVWAGLLEGLGLRGDERILDLGCGRGAVLMLAARRLTTGRAVGVDLWRGVDQSGNSAEATRRNAVAEGVADRIEVLTGDMAALPFEDGSFDLIVSNFAIHNIRSRAGRKKAIEEAVRVLRPGGRLRLADMRATGLYQAHLVRLGMAEVTRQSLGWRCWCGSPFVPTRLVSATKPKAFERIAPG